ncbi:MAG TPA: S9 family peptidase [Prolixibacteraceae bacterium]|nr:S9 family peptidase [Prolixibacteraceae bacterium]
MRLITTFLLLGIFFSTPFLLLGQNQLTLDDFIVNKTFSQKTVNGLKSMNDGEHYSSIEESTSIVKYSYKTGKQVDIILDLNTIENCPIKNISAYEFSSNENRILLETNPKSIYRHSYSANYYVWDHYTETLYDVSENGPQQVATFSPDGERIAFVRDNNVFIKTIRFGTELQVTFDGKKNEIINGVPDWVYEEEFSYNKAFEWSPDSKMLAFVKFNESQVREFTIPMYKGLSPENNENALYPGEYTFKYPKAGEKNSEVSVHIFDVKTRTQIKVNVGDNVDIYIPRIKWSLEGNDLAVFRLNRIQNELTLLYANPFTGDTRTLVTERNNRFIDQAYLDQFCYLDDGKHFVVLSERDGWSHLYLYRNNGFLVKQITTGKFDVTDFYGFDVKQNTFYYQAAKKSPLQREVYSISLDGKKETLISKKEGTSKIIFGKEYQYYLLYHSSKSAPLKVSVHNQKGKELRVIIDNDELLAKVKSYTMPMFEFIRFKTPQDIELNGYLIKPSNFDPNNKYPVVITQYSGPNSQEVLDSWNIDWHYFLAEQGYIVASIDPRGTAARGEEFRKCTYLQLGKLESDDMVEAAKHIASLPFTDEQNMAIWGWSYGGFMTALCMNKGGELFKAGIAVAPVTNWRYYDTVYTERFMRTPQQNPFGYDDNSTINNVKNIKGNLLLIHGTADDNVHVQNTFEYTEALVQAEIPFDMHIYTNRNHSIFGGNTRVHLYKKMLSFFDHNLK